MIVHQMLETIKNGFANLSVDQIYKDSALINLESWLTNSEYKEYVPQIEYLVEVGNWDLLLDAFYQILPFGTAGRRGQVGIGPNRINIWSIQASAQGHSQYLIKTFGEEAKNRGIVISYDVRAYLKDNEYDNSRPNPVKGLDCKTLAVKSAEVYSANGILVYLFENIAPTPELAFMIRRLNAISGNMISASHNPPEHNGQKVLNETGGQLLPPFDQVLVDTVVNDVKEIKSKSLDQSIKLGLLKYVSNEDLEAYEDAASKTSINTRYRSAKVYFSPFHGTCYKTFPSVFRKLGFDIVSDEASSIPDPTFSTITFNIPNPEVVESFRNLIPGADNTGADIILVTDPDADRVGVMSKEAESWQFYTGNEIGILITAYVLSELKENNKLKPSNTIVKTIVTTNLIEKLAQSYGIHITSDLLVGFKYIGEIMEKMQVDGTIADFLLGIEESNGSIAGNYIREKDGLAPGILLAELASKLKAQGKTLGLYLNEVYEDFGYFMNYLTEIRLPGAEGMTSIAKIQSHLREIKPNKIGDFEVEKYVDKWDGEAFLSPTDQDSRNLLVMKFAQDEKLSQLQVIIRPSGTEPKLKFYFEIGVESNKFKDLEDMKTYAKAVREALEKDVLKYCYKIIGIDFPDRAFLLFWQLPAQIKMKYFVIEKDIEQLRQIADLEIRRAKLNDLLKFLGSDPIDKIDKAFIAKNEVGILKFLGLE